MKMSCKRPRQICNQATLLLFLNHGSYCTVGDIEFIGNLLISHSMIMMASNHSENLVRAPLPSLLWKPLYLPENECLFKVQTDLLNCWSLCMVCFKCLAGICKLIIWIEFNSNTANFMLFYSDSWNKSKTFIWYLCVV